MNNKKAINTIISVLILICLTGSLVFATYSINESLKPKYTENEIALFSDIASELLPDSGNFVPYARESLVGINKCYISENGTGMVTLSNIISEGMEFEIYVGVNAEGMITGIEVQGNDFEKNNLSTVITDDYLKEYIGVIELNENNLEEYIDIEVKEEARVLSESIYQTAKLALKQYGEIYE